MQVYLLRHGIAEEGAGISDADRSLTNEGRQKLKHVLTTVEASDVAVDLILTSPLKRAVQTAEIAAEVLGYKQESVRTRALTPSATPEEAWEELRVHKDVGSVLLVGHNPLFSHLAAFLLNAPNMQIDFKKGAMMNVEIVSFRPQPHAFLGWYLTARLARHADGR